jgi:hypothetical protein
MLKCCWAALFYLFCFVDREFTNGLLFIRRFQVGLFQSALDKKIILFKPLCILMDFQSILAKFQVFSLFPKGRT